MRMGHHHHRHPKWQLGGMYQDVPEGVPLVYQSTYVCTDHHALCVASRLVEGTRRPYSSACMHIHNVRQEVCTLYAHACVHYTVPGESPIEKVKPHPMLAPLYTSTRRRGMRNKHPRQPTECASPQGPAGQPPPYAFGHAATARQGTSRQGM